MIISDKMKPVIITLLIILAILFGMRCYQKFHQPKKIVQTEEQEMMEVWTQYLINLQKHVKSHANLNDNHLYAEVTFNIDKSGKISNVAIAQTSDNKNFDNQAIIAVKKSSPCAPLPAKYKGKGVTVSLTLGEELLGSQILQEW